MAATRLIPMHVNKGKTAAASIKERIDYAQNPDKTNGGELISSYECDSRLAWQEFMLDRGRYLAGHRAVPEGDVLAYQIRQSFKPGEITPEEANRVGYELAMRFTKGKHAFTVSTHIDRKHIHNHIIFAAVDLQAERKFRNFFLSTYAVRKLSDTICVEHGLSIIEDKPKREWKSYRKHERKVSNRERLRMELDEILEKKPESFEDLLGMLERSGYQIKRGKYVSVRAEKTYGFIRFRSLGEGYREEDLRATIESRTTVGDGRKKIAEQSSCSFSLMKNYEDVLRQKKGKGYERWAMHFNNTQAAEGSGVLPCKRKRGKRARSTRPRIRGTCASGHRLPIR